MSNVTLEVGKALSAHAEGSCSCSVEPGLTRQCVIAALHPLPLAWLRSLINSNDNWKRNWQAVRDYAEDRLDINDSWDEEGFKPLPNEWMSLVGEMDRLEGRQ